MRSAAGLTIAPRFLITGAAGDQLRPEVIGLGDDRFAVVWVDNNTSRFRLAIHDIGGNVLTAAADVSASPSFVDNFRQIDLAELDNGNFVIAYRPNVGGSSDAVFRIFNRSGAPVTAEINVDGLLGARGVPAVAALADDRFVVMNGNGTAGRIFNSSGTALTAVFPVLSTGELPQVAALADGRFMVVAVSLSGEVIARVMFADGTPDGAQFTVHTVATAAGFSTVAPSVATLADGRVVISWTTAENGNLDVKAAIYDPRESGLFTSATDANDGWVGTRFADTILAGGGNDSIYGGDGADALFGEDGRDGLVGDAGNDYIDGGNGSDSLFA